jgi:hypothetical protein
MNETGQTMQQSLNEEVQRKLGRNLLLFQQIEGVLKALLVDFQEQGTISDLIANQKQRSDKVRKQMMGQLVEQYIDGILSDADENLQELEDSSLPWMSLTFTVAGEQEFSESQRRNLKLMVDERNDLIHHFLPRWRPESMDDQTKAFSYLDKQHEKVLPMLEHLLLASEFIQESRQSLADFLGSDKGIAALLGKL